MEVTPGNKQSSPGWMLPVGVVSEVRQCLPAVVSLCSAAQAYYAAKGIQLAKGVLAKEIKGDADGKVASVTLSDGRSLPADVVLVGAGARPASSLVK